MGRNIFFQMEHTNNCIYTRYFFIVLNIKITTIYSNIYTNIIFIEMVVKITGHTGKYLEILYFIEIHTIITQASVIFLMSPWIIRVPFYRVVFAYCWFVRFFYSFF